MSKKKVSSRKKVNRKKKATKPAVEERILASADRLIARILRRPKEERVRLKKIILTNLRVVSRTTDQEKSLRKTQRSLERDLRRSQRKLAKLQG